MSTNIPPISPQVPRTPPVDLVIKEVKRSAACYAVMLNGGLLQARATKLGGCLALSFASRDLNGLLLLLARPKPKPVAWISTTY